MSRSVPLWFALTACAGSLLVGAVAFAGRGVQAQNDAKKPAGEGAPREYSYLPEKYGEVHFVSEAEWRSLYITAIGGGKVGLTDEFAREALTCFAGPKGLDLTIDLIPQPVWKYSLPGGKFNAPAEKVKPALVQAVKANQGLVRGFFPELQEKDLRVRVYITGDSVGVFENGKLTLNSEK